MQILTLKENPGLKQFRVELKNPIKEFQKENFLSNVLYPFCLIAVLDAEVLEPEGEKKYYCRIKSGPYQHQTPSVEHYKKPQFDSEIISL